MRVPPVLPEELDALGVAVALRAAADLLDQSGISVGVSLDGESIDICVALAVAMGANQSPASKLDDPLSSLPASAAVPARLALDVLASDIQDDVLTWQDSTHALVVTYRLRDLAARIELISKR